MQHHIPHAGSRLTRSQSYRDSFQLSILQDPEVGKAICGEKPKPRGSRWPLDPPPVIELEVKDGDAARSFLHSPYWFCTAELITLVDNGKTATKKGLQGCTVSSLHKIKLTDNKEHGLFVFGDLNIHNSGTHRLRFSLFEMRQCTDGSSMFAEKLTDILSKDFQVHPSKSSVVQRSSTPLSKSLCEAGIKIRIRKDTRGKPRYQPVDWTANGDFTLPMQFHPGDPRFALTGRPMMGGYGQGFPPVQRPVNSIGLPLDQSKFSYKIHGGGLGLRGIMDQDSSQSAQDTGLAGHHVQNGIDSVAGYGHPFANGHFMSNGNNGYHHSHHLSADSHQSHFPGSGHEQGPFSYQVDQQSVNSGIPVTSPTPTANMLGRYMTLNQQSGPVLPRTTASEVAARYVMASEQHSPGTAADIVGHYMETTMPMSTAGYAANVVTSADIMNSTLSIANPDIAATSHPSLDHATYLGHNSFNSSQSNGHTTDHTFESNMRLPPFNQPRLYTGHPGTFGEDNQLPDSTNYHIDRSGSQSTAEHSVESVDESWQQPNQQIHTQPS